MKIEPQICDRCGFPGDAEAFFRPGSSVCIGCERLALIRRIRLARTIMARIRPPQGGEQAADPDLVQALDEALGASIL
jgi:hypothetical protein